MKPILWTSIVILTLFITACGGASAPTPIPAATPLSKLLSPTGGPAATSAPVGTAASQVPAALTQAPAATEAPTATAEAANAPATSAPAATTAADATAPTAASGDLPAPPSGSGLDVIKSALLAQLQAKSYRSTTVTESADGKQTTRIVEYVAPDRMHVVLDQGMEEIAIKGKGLWSKQGGAWVSRGAQGADTLFAAIDPSTVEQTLATIGVQSIKFDDAELLDGKPVFVYNYQSAYDLGNGTTLKSNAKVYIGALDHRIYKLDAVTDSYATPGKTDHSVSTIEYDIPITIEAPI